MKHLTEQQIELLADKTKDMIPFHSEELELLDHLEKCQECYEAFCVAVALLEAVENAGGAALTEKAFTEMMSPIQTLLAVVKVIHKEVRSAAESFLEQIDLAASSLFLEPAVAESRGGKDLPDQSSVLESMENERTFISFDPTAGTIQVQVDEADIPSGELQIIVQWPDGQVKQLVPVVRDGVAMASCSHIRAGCSVRLFV